MSSSTDLPGRMLASWDSRLSQSDESFRRRYPGAPGPGPIHTVYVPVSKLGPVSIDEWRTAALRSISDNVVQWDVVLTELVGGSAGGATGQSDDKAQLASRTLAKILTEPIEDLRIDFEDGFRPHRGTAQDDEDEDGHALRAAAVVADWSSAERVLPRSWGIRIRSLAPDTRRRGLRTLSLFLSELLALTRDLPTGFVLTLPKVTSTEQVGVFCEVLAALEAIHGLAPGSLRFEIQVETPQTVLGGDGTAPLPEMIHASKGRVSGLHFGTYDYTASLGILGAYQNLRHPAADFAKSIMVLAAAETGVRVSDGSDNKVPVGDGETVLQRWLTHAQGVQRALRLGIYQGWDLHPAQLPTRFAATFAFFRAGHEEAALRLATYHRQTATAIMDEPATAFALARHLAAAVHCGAVTAAELAATAAIGPGIVSRYLTRGAVPGGDDQRDHPPDHTTPGA